ncbi:TIGR02594 family protein [Prosthecobacter sp.]|jgi:uncharacterized protein (TIGR02594 family)|uniref:TIGR02594 family protein n=1 Tax=Prosthecobacter sp. TaxID=1965333 RepID=UPI0037C6FF1B
MTANQRIYQAALKYRGVCEVPGPKSNKIIQGWIKEAASWLGDDVGNDDSRVAWCGCFRGHIGTETMTGTPPACYRAANWMNWGNVVNPNKPTTWLQGDTLIFKRAGGSHVTLFADFINCAAGRVNCLGGNQADKVCITSLTLDNLLGVRRAPDL